MEDIVVILGAGSTLYGTEVETSDKDSIKLLMPNIDHIVGLQRSKRIGGDRQTYYIHDFVRLLLKGSPQQFEALFTPDMLTFDNYTHAWQWHQLRAIHYSFWCRKQVNAVRGYINAEMHRIDRHRRWLKGEYTHEERKRFCKWTPREEMKEHGWDTKGGAHVMRLAMQANEYEKDQHVTFPRPEAEMLVDIRNGGIGYSIWLDKMEKLDRVWEAPDEPNLYLIRMFLRQLYREVLA